MSEQRYFVTGMQRSGSTAIHNALRGHPQVSAFKCEIGFEPFFRDGASYFCFGGEPTEKERKKAPPTLFDALTGLNASDETRAFGIKCLMLKPAHAREFRQILNTRFPDALVVRLRRDDPVAQFGSLIKARRTGVWQREENSLVKVDQSKVQRVNNNGDLTDVAIELDRYELLEHIISSHKVDQALSKLNESHRVYNVNYEQDIKNADLRDVSNLEPLYDFLNVASVSPQWIQTKKLSPPPEEYISNYESLSKFAREVRDELAGGMSPQAVRERYGPPLTRRVADSIHWHVNHPISAARKIWNNLFES